jgi:hypothetical protein
MQNIITDHTITLITKNGPSVIGKTHPNFYKIKKALILKNFLEVESLLDVKTGFHTFSNGLIKIEGDNLMYNDSIVHNVLTQRIIEMIHNNDKVEPIINFLVNLMDNPSEGSIDQLYTFLEHKNLPITEDGCFLAYKAINSDYTDKYTGTISNKVGDKVKMPYNEVTADPKCGCSRGLHCGSIEYVRQYGEFKLDEYGKSVGDRLVTVKVNPSDVVSVPEDAEHQKVRVYRYVVHEEIENPFDLVPKYEAPIYYDEDSFGDGDYNTYYGFESDNEWSCPSGELGPDDSNLHSDPGPLGSPSSSYDCGNPVEGLIDFDAPERKESILAGCIRQSTDNPLKKNSFDTSDIVGDVDVDMYNTMYNNTDYANGQPSEKNSFDVVGQDENKHPMQEAAEQHGEELKKNESFTYEWHGVSNTQWEVVERLTHENSRKDLHLKAQEIFQKYQDKYSKDHGNISYYQIIDDVIDELKYEGFDHKGEPRRDHPNQMNFDEEMFQDASCYATKNTEKNSFDSNESDKSELPDPPSEIILDSDKDSNEESVVKVETPNNIILPDNN